MKHFTIFLLTIISFQLHAQTTALLDTNNVKAQISDNGIFFTDEAMGLPAYEIPQGSGNHTTFTMAFWMTAIDGGGQLHASCQQFMGSQDIFAGPIADDYNSTYYTNEFNSAIWSMSKADINYHLANYTSSGYVADNSILNWPANGDVSEGVAEQLAPYVDVNADNVYNPYDGDYPYIQGDKAVYVIMNDMKDVHAETGADPLGVEVHVMFYQFTSNDDINNTTFMNVKVYNRSSSDYGDFRFGLFMDYDLGNYQDDYVGTDSTRNMTYVYNGDAVDEANGGQAGYGNNPPAFGTMLLNETLGTSTFFSNGVGGPTGPTDFYNLMNGIIGGVQMTNNVGAVTNFAYSGDPYAGTGWNELDESNAMGDRRIVMSSESSGFVANEWKCYDYAFIFNQSDTSNLTNLNALYTTADFVQNFYDTQIQPCGNIVTGISESKLYPVTLSPNPSNGTFQVDIEEAYEIEIFDLNGKLVFSESVKNSNSVINTSLENGLYLVRITSRDKSYFDKIQILK